MQIRTGYADNCYVHTRFPEIELPVSTTFNIEAANCQNEDGIVQLEVTPPAQEVRWYIEGRNSYTDTTFIAENVPAGWHSVRIESPAECTLYDVPFYMPAAVSFDVQMNSQPSCEDALGELEVIIQEPEIGELNISWSNGAEGTINTNLSAGWYSVTVTDENDCSRHENFFLPATVPCLSTISGRAYINTDCVCEIDSNALAFSNLQICATSDSYTHCTYSNHAGEYTLAVTEPGNYSISTISANNDYISENCLPDPIEIGAIGENISNVDIFYCDEPIYDAAISINSSTPRPGFEQSTTVRLRNTGTFTFDTAYVNATISPLIDIDYISPQPISFDPSTNEISWLSSLPLSRSGYFDYAIRGTVVGELGEELTNSASVQILETEETYDNNESSYISTIIGSYDPNDKQVFPRGSGEDGSISSQDSLLHYSLRFQNTGTDTAFTVIIRDTLDPEVYDLSTINPGRSSHPVSVDIEEGNILVFSFFNILLPDSTTSLAESMGYVQFDIQLKSDLPAGTPIENTAAIYFDFNDPIITNTTLNTITATRDLRKPPLHFEVFPNPSPGDARILFELEEYLEGLTVEVFDAQGRLIQRKSWPGIFPTGPSTLPLSTFDVPSGIYLIKISTKNGAGSRKWIKL